MKFAVFTDYMGPVAYPGSLSHTEAEATTHLAYARMLTVEHMQPVMGPHEARRLADSLYVAQIGGLEMEQQLVEESSGCTGVDCREATG